MIKSLISFSLLTLLCMADVEDAVSQFQMPLSAASGSGLPKSPVSVTSYTNGNSWIASMTQAERIRQGIVPKRGFVSTGVAGGTLISGDGKMLVELPGNPLSDRITFRHERLLDPWPAALAAPKIANVLPEVRKLILQGRHADALALALTAATADGMPPGVPNHSEIIPFWMRIDLTKAGEPKNFLRSTDFESGELNVFWSDNRGDWVRRTFVSRADNVVVQYLTAPPGQKLDVTVALDTDLQPARKPAASQSEVTSNQYPGGHHVQYHRDFNENRLIVSALLNPELGSAGFAGVTRVVPVGGSIRIENGQLVVSGAQSLTLLTRIEWNGDYSSSKAEDLARALNHLPADYPTLLARHRKIQAEIMDRVAMNFGGATQFGMSVEELMSDQQIRQGYSPALLEQIYDMGRYWLLAEGTGDYPSLHGQMNINYNLQIAPAAMAALPEASEVWTKWIEGLLPDSRKNAENIFGARGALFSVHPNQQNGVSYHYHMGEPHLYWVSAGGWAYNPIWDYYLTTGDKEFLRQEVVPGLKEIALFYEDYLKLTDDHGNYIFVPSFSPENWPANVDASAPSVINAVMDIAVCREVLTHLIEAAKILDADADQVPKWKTMLAKMPPYLVNPDGSLKEWAWPTLEDHLDYRHASHLYGAWPADEVDPDRTPELAKAVWLADRKRAQGNGGGGSSAAGFGLAHRALAAARLKDSYLVNMELKQLLEQGYVGPTLRTSHNPYTGPMPDEQGAIPTLMMEMLLYSRPGVVEVLPAMPETLTHGSVKGILSRTFIKVDELTWNLEASTVDLTITSRRKQDITLIVRYGIEAITAPAGVLAVQPKPDATTCVLHLPEGAPVALQMKIGGHKPSDWILKMASS